jgi:hypothetical protein
LEHFSLAFFDSLGYDKGMKREIEGKVRTAVCLSGGFHSSATVNEPVSTGRPMVLMVESYEAGQWITRRQVWNEATGRYEVAA